MVLGCLATGGWVLGSTFSSLACGLFLPPPLLASAAGSSLRLGWEEREGGGEGVN